MTSNCSHVLFELQFRQLRRKKNNSKIVLSFTNKHEFYSNWKLSKLRKSAIQKSHIALYNVFRLSSLANPKRDILLSIL